MGSRGGRGRGPGSLGEPGGGDLGGLSSPDLGLDLSLNRGYSHRIIYGVGLEYHCRMGFGQK